MPRRGGVGLTGLRSSGKIILTKTFIREGAKPSSEPRSHRVLLAIAIAMAAAAAVRADYEAPTGAYDPGSYYSAINTANPATLRSQLNTRINSGYTNQTYDGFGDDWGDIDADPAKTGYVLEIYTRQSTKATDNTLSREHQWVNSRLNDSNALGNGDYFNLRPLNNTINSNRGNLNYTSVRTSDGSTGKVVVGGTTYWYAGDQDRGDVARVMFYMATMYGMTIVEGNPSGSAYQMGDLQSILRNNYADGVDNFERRRNAKVQSYQKNRNPFVDHPEYVWATFGGGSNNSQLSVSAAATDGSSSKTVTLTTVIKGAALGTGSFTLSKSGDNATTIDITTAGAATTASAGAGQNVDYGVQSKAITVGLTSGTATAGLKSGTVTINNTDLTTSGTGHGSGDGNDVVTVNATVLDHSNASFSKTADVNVASINLGTFDQKAGATQSIALSQLITDLSTTAGYTAGLDLDSIKLSSGSTAIGLSGTFTNLAELNSAGLLASLNLGTVGGFTATYLLGLSDQDLSGATSANSETLLLTLSGVVAVPEPAMLSLLGLAGLTMLRRRTALRGR